MTTPVRLRLARSKGFDLQTFSRLTNGLAAVNVGRPSRWGNPFITLNEEGWPLIERQGGGSEHYNHAAQELLGQPEVTWENERAVRVALFRAHCLDGLPDLAPLRGRNLACWCPLPADRGSDCCHAAVLLEIANA